MKIRVFIYDDNMDRVESLKGLFSFYETIDYLGFSENCQNVLDDMTRYNPDVVLMDIQMPVVDGIEGLKLIKRSFPSIKVLMQTAFDDNNKIFSSITQGASGYILKSDNPHKIIQSIEEVYEGGAAMNPGIALQVLNYFKPKHVEVKLSPKELEVLSLLANGLSYKMVANELKISHTTVNTHVKRIYEKLHISSLGEALAFYYKNLYPKA